jgi:hypothetical protein
MESPAPVNLSHLQSILAKSKQVMKKVDNDKPIVSKGTEARGLAESAISAPTTPVYSEHDEKEMMFEQYTPTPSENIHEAIDYTDEQVRNSNLPPIVKEAMLKKHLPKPKFTNSKFSLDDVSALIEKKPVQSQQIKSPGVPLHETTRTNLQTNGIMVDPSVLKTMIKEAVAEYFQERYEKNLTEATIKKTIGVLIKEGKIAVKKK